MPETRPQPFDEAAHQRWVEYIDQLRGEYPNHDWVGLEHHWVDTTAINSPDYTWVCSGCGLTRTEPKTHWPLYPEDT